MPKTTFDPNKRNAVLYPLTGNKEGEIITSDTRNYLGHELISALTQRGVRVNSLVTKKGKPRTKLLVAIAELAKKPDLREAVPMMKTKTRRNKQMRKGLQTANWTV
jgi:hypothetical protein